MVLKTFNLNEKTYKKFATFCKENGISMSKQIDFFIEAQMTDKKEVREEYLKKLEGIRKHGVFHRYTSFEDFEKAVS